MYKVTDTDDYLLVKFEEAFTRSDLKALISQKILREEYAHKNDIWLIGAHQAHLYMDDILSIVDDIKHLHPNHVEGSKTALVVNEGLNAAIMDLLAEGLTNQLSFEYRLFHTLKEAKTWIGVAEETVA